MIIDCILDRKENDELIAQGYTHARFPNGELKPLAYNARNFYRSVLDYGEIGNNITCAMDYGTENDVKNALCAYITGNDYNTEICDYIRSVNWLS